MESRVQKSIDIAVPQKNVYDFLVDPLKIPLVLPGLVENTDVPKPPLVTGSNFHYRYQMYGVMLEGTWHVTLLDPPNRYEARTDGEVTSKWVYVLKEMHGLTHIDLEVTYETPSSLAGKVKGEVLVKINEQEATHYLQNLKTVLEMQA